MGVLAPEELASVSARVTQVLENDTGKLDIQLYECDVVFKTLTIFKTKLTHRLSKENFWFMKLEA